MEECLERLLTRDGFRTPATTGRSFTASGSLRLDGILQGRYGGGRARGGALPGTHGCLRFLGKGAAPRRPEKDPAHPTSTPFLGTSPAQHHQVGDR